MEKKSKYLDGFLTGILITVIIAGIGFFFYHNAITKVIEEKVEGTKTSNMDDSQLPYNEVKIGAIYELIDDYFLEEYSEEDLENGVYQGILAALDDPYSVYYTPEELKELQQQSSGVYYGIGVQISQNVSTGVMTVTKVFENCPGDEAGMLPGDVIVEVAGKSMEGVDVSTAVTYIKSEEEGTFVEIKVYRASISDYVTMQVERRKVETPTVEYEMLDDGIGYILLSGFEEVTAKQFKNALDDLKSQNAKGLIVDVRGNPGGLLTAVNDILRNVLPEGLIVYTEDKNGKRVEYECDGSRELDIPMVVLINGNSASAAEIFAGAVKDYDKATLVGTTTFGKGIVQSVISLGDGSAVKLTVSKYYTPNGVNIHGTGIAPDVEVELDEELLYEVTIPKEKDNQLQKAIEVLKEKM